MALRAVREPADDIASGAADDKQCVLLPRDRPDGLLSAPLALK